MERRCKLEEELEGLRSHPEDMELKKEFLCALHECMFIELYLLSSAYLWKNGSYERVDDFQKKLWISISEKEVEFWEGDGCIHEKLRILVKDLVGIYAFREKVH